jgi:cytochrome b561
VEKRQAQGEPRPYDNGTIVLHWLTAVLAIALFATALWWQYAPRAVRFRFELEDIHVSLGLMLALVVVLRLLWRLLQRHPSGAAGHGLARVLAKTVHVLLYVLLAAQVVLGPSLSGLVGGELSFFGLFTLPNPVGRNREVADLVGQVHNWSAWVLIVLAGGHAAMALLHHYVGHDDVLGRMLPTFGSRR